MGPVEDPARVEALEQLVEARGETDPEGLAGELARLIVELTHDGTDPGGEAAQGG